jgi:hypothetical protein
MLVAGKVFAEWPKAEHVIDKVGVSSGSDDKNAGVFSR